MPLSHAPLLLTRPEADSRRFAAAAAQRLGAGPVVISPVLDIVPVGPVPSLEGYAGVVLTSANGVMRRSAAWPKGLLAYCVGTRTCAAAADAGFFPHSAEGALPQLVELIQAKQPDGPLLYLRGRHATGDLATTLTQLGVPTDEAIVYDQEARPLSETAKELLAQDGPVLIPVFSTRSARVLAPALKNTAATLLVAAISPAVASALPVHSAAMIALALRPDAAAVLDRIAEMQSGLRA